MANYFEGEMKIDVNLEGLSQQFKAKAIKAFERVASELDGRYADAITNDYWDWPRDTKRGIGGPKATLREKARAWKNEDYDTGTPRDIKDSGGIKGSQNMELDSANFTCSWVWNTKYAAAVHEGARIYPWGNKKRSKVELPARPWTSAVTEGTHGVPKYDYLGKFKKYFGT